MTKYTDYHFFFKNKTPLSQWYKRDFIAGGILNLRSFNCMEQYMMFQKAIFFKDFITAEKISDAKNPSEHKALGRTVMNFDEEKWIKVREKIIYQGNLAKFSQNSDLKEYLLSTGDIILVEASPFDRIYGIGYDIFSKEVQQLDTEKWGLNLLGKCLMQVREELKCQK